MSSESHDPHAAIMAWVKLWHPRGVDVRIPLPAADMSALLQSVTNALDAGWLIEAPGLVEGEHKEMIGWVAHRQKENDDGSLTPIVDLYPDDDKLGWSILTVYLNRPADVADFESASSLKLTAIPVHVGGGKLERGATKQTDALIARAPKAFAVAWKANPRHDPNETDAKKKKPKRIFSRWPDLAPAQPKAQSIAPSADNQGIIDLWNKWLAEFPHAGTVNDVLHELAEIGDMPTKARVWEMICTHAKQRGWIYHADQKRFDMPEVPV